MSMTKKDYILLADALRPSFNAGALRVKDAEQLADAIARSNPLFKRARWLDYLRGVCGQNGGPTASVKAARAGLIPHDKRNDEPESGPEFTMTVRMENAAFEENGMASELARILRAVAVQVEAGDTGRKAMDANGNAVGSWEVR